MFHTWVCLDMGYLKNPMDYHGYHHLFPSNYHFEIYFVFGQIHMHYSLFQFPFFDHF